MTDTGYRLFAAVDLSPALLRSSNAVLADLRRRVPTGVRWVQSEQLHVTMKFFGAVRTDDLERVKDVLDRAARSVPPPRIAVVGAGTFPPRGAPRVVWLGLEDDGGALAALHDAVEMGSEGLGFSRESRDFRPHLTLGRVRPSQGWSGRTARAATALRAAIAPLAGHEFGGCVIDELVLYRSELNQDGARYTALARFPVGPDAA